MRSETKNYQNMGGGQRLWRRWGPVALGAAVFALTWFATGGMAGGTNDVVNVVRVKRDIPAGSTIRLSDVETVAFPRDLAPPGALASVGDAVGKSTPTTLFAGDVVHDRRLDGEGSPASLALETGMRAVTVPVDLGSGLAGMIRPGWLVDVAVDPTRSGLGKAQILLRRARVLDVRTSRGRPLGAETQGSPEAQPPGAVTLAMTEPEVLLILPYLWETQASGAAPYIYLIALPEGG